MITIITHCWDDPRIPIYSDLLRIQINSLFTWPPDNTNVELVVAYCEEDARTRSVVREGEANSDDQIKVTGLPLAKGWLMRRSIGRNIASRTMCCKSDVVWFADCDYVFGKHCLDDTCDQVLQSTCPPGVLFYPRKTLISKNHQIGDNQRQDLSGSEFANLTLFLDDFEEKIEDRAIGGIQIVTGVDAHSLGYLNGHPKWQQPKRDDESLDNFRDDLEYRRNVMTGAQVIDIRGLYRIRHSQSSMHKDVHAVQDVESQVIKDIRKRQDLGVRKYGTTVAGNSLDAIQWLQHAYEECLDQSVYLKRAINQLKEDGK